MLTPRRPLCLVLFAAVLFSGLPGSAQETLPVAVFVTHLEVPPPPPLRPEAHAAQISARQSEMFDVAEKLRNQHGNKTSAWPPAVWKEFYVAEDAHRLAEARRDYQAPESRLLLADSVEDFQRGANENKAIQMVTSAADAALVVQITGRRRTSPKGPTDNRYFIRFRLTPGAKMTFERFDELTTGAKWDTLWSKIIAHPTAAAPYADLEAASMASWKNCAGGVRSLVEGFVRARMDPARKK